VALRSPRRGMDPRPSLGGDRPGIAVSGRLEAADRMARCLKEDQIVSPRRLSAPLPLRQLTFGGRVRQCW
jgi:hypothetical protein